MTEVWYKRVEPGRALTQGDLIFSCPLIGWDSQPIKLHGRDEKEVLRGASTIFEADVVVMTQACDLAQNKFQNIILCSHLGLDVHRVDWEAEVKRRNQNPTERNWRAYCDDICNGFVYNLAMLNQGADGDLKINRRVVDFSEVFSLPRTFLESLLEQRGQPRLQLLPPYREHLSQAFARFFMRVGLPVDIKL